MNFLKKYICELIFAVNLICIAPIHDFNIWWNRPVINDGFGYYGYLPAIFLHHDLNHNFIQPVWEKYYTEISLNNPKDLFMVKYKGKEVNKYPPGVAYFLSPFFITAHITTKLFGLEADGYSTIYMVFICIGAVFWQYLFLKLLKNIFIFYNLSEMSFLFTSIFLAFGSNLLFYTLLFSAYSHVYSLFSITLFFYGGIKFFNYEQEKYSPYYFVLMILGFVLTIITRNVNAICIVLLPCMGFQFRNSRNYLKVLTTPFAILGFAISIAILFSMFLFWYLNTGYWLIDSYPNEFFNWSTPQIIKSLFSAHKGWFFYTPVAILGVIGLFFTKKKLKINALIVLCIVIYFTSSWGSWDYGSGFSLRAYIDWYLLIGIGIGFLITKTQFRNTVFAFVITVGFIFSALNVLFSVQFMKGIISGHSQGIEYTIKNFFRLRPILEFKVSKKIILQTKIVSNNFDESPQGYVSLNKSTEYAGTLESTFPVFFKDGVSFKIRYGGEISMADKNSDVFLCASVTNEKDSMLFWQQIKVNDYVLEKNSEKVETGFDYPPNVPLNSRIRIFFWKPKGSSECQIDNTYIEFMQTGFE